MTFELYRYSGNKRLRCGYTTGACAALAAAAATQGLLTGAIPATARLDTPVGETIEAEVADASLADAKDGRPEARCCVRKDAGDDVDATDGIAVYARATLTDVEGVRIDGGVGVGRVTKPGLDQPVGAAAINSAPRAMIESAVRGVAARFGYRGGVDVVVEVPDGQAVAGKTFNPRLGVVGGISILGTTGIVEPRSLAALADTLELEIRSHAASGDRSLVVVPGNYGRSFLETLALPADIPVVACANFVGHAVDCAVNEGLRELLLVGHIGKLAKVAGGVMDTHSRVADCRVEIIAAHAAACGAPRACVERLFACATTDACVDVLVGQGIAGAVLDRLALALQQRLEQRAGGALDVGAVMFSLQHDLAVSTPGGRVLIDRWRGLPSRPAHSRDVDAATAHDHPGRPR